MLVRKCRLPLEGAKFIGAFEGFGNHGRPYNDAADNATIGYGHLLHYGPVTARDRHRWGALSEHQAAELLQRDAHVALLAIRRHITVKRLTKGQVVALCSFAFNCGAGALGPDHSVRAAVNSKPHRWRRWKMRAWRRRVARELIQWSHAGGRELPGLVRRRRAEIVAFDTGRLTRKAGNRFANA